MGKPTAAQERAVPKPGNRQVRVFVSSTFQDMENDRNALMTHAWPQLRCRCLERGIEFAEIDLRWGISEAQATRRETLKVCLDEITACRPYFVALLGERYGWIPGGEAFTPDLREEEPWVSALRGASVTELEILHGVLNNPTAASRAFFYLRDPAYAGRMGAAFVPESHACAVKQAALKSSVREACRARKIPLREDYPSPGRLAELVLEDLWRAIRDDFPDSPPPDALSREAEGHEAFAEVRRRTYIGSGDCHDALDDYAREGGAPVLVTGRLGSGKSALLANWISAWHAKQPRDHVVQHYVGATADSVSHWRFMLRVMAEVKAWSRDDGDLPATRDEILRDFPVWLGKAGAKAEHEGTRFIVILDGVDELEDHDKARQLGWLPEHPWSGALRLVASATEPAASGESPAELPRRLRFREIAVLPLSESERRRLITSYLGRFGKRLDEARLARIVSSGSSANPLYLTTLLNELRVAGTHERLDERLAEYLAAEDVTSLLRSVLARCRRDYDGDRPGLVADVLELIDAARRGVSEAELLELLRAPGQPQLPAATWAPLRAALYELLVDRGGVLGFANDSMRKAVPLVFGLDEVHRRDRRLQLAEYFGSAPVTLRSCEELPWLLERAGATERLHDCLLDIDRFILLHKIDEFELRRHLGPGVQAQAEIGADYLKSLDRWTAEPGRDQAQVAIAIRRLGAFLLSIGSYAAAETLMRQDLDLAQRLPSPDAPEVAGALNNLAALLHATGRSAEAEPMIRRALEIRERHNGSSGEDLAVCLNTLARVISAEGRFREAEALMRRALAIETDRFGSDHPAIAVSLNNLGRTVLPDGRPEEAGALFRRALEIEERHIGRRHPRIAVTLNNLAQALQDLHRHAEAEEFMRSALEVDERACGPAHPDVARDLNNLAMLLHETGRTTEAEPLMRRALDIDRASLGERHPHVARDLNNLAKLLQGSQRLAEAVPLIRRALDIDQAVLGPDHPRLAARMSNLGIVLQDLGRLDEAEPLFRRALEIDERTLGRAHPKVANRLNNLALLLQASGRMAEAEPLMRQMVEIFLAATRSTGRAHPNLRVAVNNYVGLLEALNRSEQEIRRTISELGPEFRVRD